MLCELNNCLRCRKAKKIRGFRRWVYEWDSGEDSIIPSKVVGITFGRKYIAWNVYVCEYKYITANCLKTDE